MFGYVRPDKAELKIKEFDTYKAIYCSLCKTLGKQYGVFSKALLTYDATFYIILMKSVLQDKPDCAYQGRCRFNPLKRCNYIDEDELLGRAAALSVIMFYYKVLDDLKDSRFLRRLLCRIIYPYIKLKFNKAVKKYSQFDSIIKPSVERQAEYEAQSEISVDKACDPSANALGEILAFGITDESQRNSLYRLGYCIGRWVYLMDAFDDIEADLKSHSFNPFVSKYSIKEIKDLDGDVENGICGSIRVSANEAADALNSIKKNCYSSIVENIIFDGTEFQLNKLIEDKEKGKSK